MEEQRVFMVEFELPAVFTEEFTSRIPDQRMVIDSLLAKGQIQSYSLALDRRKLWAIVNADSESDVWTLLDRFPLRDFMEPFIHELMFHNVTSPAMSFSLN
jgi:hypothetical protein